MGGCLGKERWGRGVAEHRLRAGLQPGSFGFAGWEKGAARKNKRLKREIKGGEREPARGGGCALEIGASPHPPPPPRLRARLQRRRRGRGGLRGLPEGPGDFGLGTFPVI